MQVSVVIPTCDRKARLLALLQDLERSTHPLHEIIIVDSGGETISMEEQSQFKNKIKYLRSERSVCIQRNTGIGQATSGWILLCDDDVELPADYLEKLAAHTRRDPNIGAVSGLWLEKTNSEWKGNHPENSTLRLVWKFIFKLGIWGEIESSPGNFMLKRIKKHYSRKANHISKAGWPVITDFSGDHFITPVYSLGAALVKKDWLLNSPYDGTLDRCGIGDNYGVILGFPNSSIHVLNNTQVYHHKEPINRLNRSLQYYRRALAIDYFIKTGKTPPNVRPGWLAWSLTGNLVSFIFSADWKLIRPSVKSIWKIISGTNPYYRGMKRGERIIEPIL
jgi:glycosyltransferase involved in cell wall biosynthesis